MPNQTPSNKTEFAVSVCRIAYGHKTLTIQANSLKEAQELALDEAGNHAFSESNSDYVLADEPTENELKISALQEEIDKLKKEAATHAQLAEQHEKLRTAAKVVTQRWDSPLWRQEFSTAQFIADLRAACQEQM